MIDCSSDAQMWFKRSFPELKTVAVLANSWKSDRPRLVVSHTRRIVKGKLLVSIVDKHVHLKRRRRPNVHFARIQSLIGYVLLSQCRAERTGAVQI